MEAPSTKNTIGCAGEPVQPDVPKMYHFICRDCETKYTSSSQEAPPSPRWVDGHVCNMSSTTK